MSNFPGPGALSHAEFAERTAICTRLDAVKLLLGLTARARLHKGLYILSGVVSPKLEEAETERVVTLVK